MFDIPTMLQLIGMIINPSTCGGILDLKLDIQNARLGKLSWNVTDMCDKMMGYYLLIGELHRNHEDVILDTYSAPFSG